MTYYRVKPQYDNQIRYRWNNHHQGVPDGIVIGNELYTPREHARLAMCPEWFEKVKVKKTQTYFAFGARFAMEN